MGEYGYGYSNYNTVGGRTDEAVGPVTRKPFAPFVPNSNYTNYSDPYGRPPNTANEALASRRARFSPSSTDWRQSPPYTGSNGYRGDYGGNYSNKPIVRRESYYDNGYGYGGSYNNKESYNPIGSTIRNDSYDGYHRENGYGGTYSNKNAFRNDSYDSYDRENGYGGNYSNREGYNPETDGYYRPAGTAAGGGGWTRPKIGSSWSTPPRSETQLATKPTSDVSKTVELVKEAERVASIVTAGHNNSSKHKTEATNNTVKAMELVTEAEKLRSYVAAAPKGNNGNSKLSEPTSNIGKAIELVKEAERIKTVVSGPPTTSNKDYYRESYDNSDARMRYGNFNFSSRPRTTTY